MVEMMAKKLNLSGLANDAQALNAARYPQCGVSKWLDDLTPAPRRDAEEAFRMVELSAAALVKALRNNGAAPTFSPSTLNRHRRGDCSCGQNGNN